MEYAIRFHWTNL
ncbi:hypothetical protein TIFTF001_045235 [Ficus carica]|uniref:Uncharacterized protein n=1 Tax=Ficus carica TaxID=3494 RepID=A0AA87Z863_FICCA|nr:hypothetical protein TIFTF001_045235 [Ficus carica]